MRTLTLNPLTKKWGQDWRIEFPTPFLQRGKLVVPPDMEGVSWVTLEGKGNHERLRIGDLVKLKAPGTPSLSIRGTVIGSQKEKTIIQFERKDARMS